MKKKIAAVLIACAALGVFLYAGVPLLSVKKSAFPESESEEKESGSSIDITGGEFAAATSGDVTLYVNPSEMTIRVVNDKERTEWCSYMSGTDKGSENALLSVSYLGEDNNLYEWDSDTYCAQLGSYEMEQLSNGVRIVMDINEGESNRFYEFLPKKMSIERYEQQFVAGLEQALADGTITQEQYDRYSSTLSLVYKKSIVEECYAVTYTGNPPTSATKQMIAIAQAVGYDSEMLAEDAETFGFTVSTTEVAEFGISMYITLEDGELVVSVPTDEMVSYNDYFTIQNIKVLPNFGAVTAAQMEEGYLLVPDGSGALMQMNTYQSGIPDYKRAVYDNDFYTDYYWASEYGEELMMPVYGMSYGSIDQPSQSFLAIIEEGAETAYIQTALAGDGTDGAANNKIYSSFDTDQYTKVKVNGPYDESSATYLVDTGVLDVDYTVRYLFLGRGETYYSMAEAYREYLVQQNDLTLTYREGQGSVYLDAIGSLTIKERIFGIPYDQTLSMTTYEQLQGILEELADIPLTVAYEGVFNGGLNNQLNNGCELVSANGSKKELTALMEYAQERGIDLYMGTALSRVYDSGNSYRASMHAVRDFSNENATIYRYFLATGALMGTVNSYSSCYEIVSPYYLEGIAENFLDEAGDYGSLYVSDLAQLYYADYDNSDMISPYDAAAVQDRVLAEMAQQKQLSLANAAMKYVGYADVITDVSRDSSEYATFEVSIPFRQLVLNGLCEYTTENVNMSSKDTAYYVLQALELGSLPKFTVTSELEDVLKNSDYSYLYAVNFDKLQETIEQVYAECAEGWAQIGTNEITGHSIVADNVFCTTYASGVSVTVNYNLTDVTLDDGTVIEAQGYLIDAGEVLK